MSAAVSSSLRSTDQIEFYFDPLCPWAWITSRFVVEVSQQRPLDIRWRLISLAVLNLDDDGNPPPPPYGAIMPIGTQNMRVLAAVSSNHTNAELGSLYTALGERLHRGGRTSEIFGKHSTEGAHLSLMKEALAEVGLPVGLVDSATDESLDEVVEASTAEALERTGPDVGTPIITYDLEHPETTSCFGPVLNRIPRGTEALEIFEAVSGLALVGGFAEMKRSNRGETNFG